MGHISTTIQRNKPILLKGIPRLIARLHPEHPKLPVLQKQLYRIGAGYSGECNVDSYIERTQFPQTVKIFTDVHLCISPKCTFQIDTLVIAERYVLIVEVKNLKNTVRFVPNPPHLEQVLETGDEVVLDCPVYQIEANRLNLDEWFRQRGIHLNTLGLLVLANPNTKVVDAPDNFPIIYKKQIPFYLQKLKPAEKILTPHQIRDITKQIYAEQQQFNPFPLCSFYHINPDDLRKGLLCRNCHGRLQRKNRETWHCPRCIKDAEDPYNDAIQDWFILVKNSMTNSDCRIFLSLKDGNAARYVISRSSLVKKGKSTATFYISGDKIIRL
ncbi:nuclease-related domain-containing protein [Sporosarcina sp. YIM B06819]|uniref:nuclease-related domain-containing protein n=1 Tax=Sporosarcina sp. YIM B06819 TaxID=3081769 RepID=UPI00298C5016|nr:nuclease-related domain-containing protein [Sporosarcina sp. YIM B06819]